jgi:hypothetical protein
VSRVSLGVALAAVCALVALAAAQPVIATSRVLAERTDAQVFIVLDTSRSMLAAAGPDGATRFDRSLTMAQGLADRLPEIPVGLASMTDRMLPHLFPTTNRRVLAATLQKTLDVESPGPSTFYSTRATSFDAIAAAPSLNYFLPSAKKRVLVVFTDGETRPVEEDLAAAFRRQPKVETVFVRLWDADERIYLAGIPEAGYAPDRESAGELERVAALVGGRVLAEGQTQELANAVADLLGSGPTIDREHEGRRRALMPYFTLAALVPLGFVLLRRNL